MIRAFRGEFGLKVMSHVPRVYAMGPGHVIEIEEGEEALYPLASEWRVVPRAQDDSRHGPPTLRGRVQRFVPTPHVQQAVNARVVICPRRRSYAALRNWEHWPALADGLDGVFAGGVRDASDTRVPCPAAWDHARPLDATIEAMLAAELVIATDSGLAHLAVLCGRPLLIIGAGEYPAPGSRWKVRIQEYFQAANHMGAPIVLEPRGWDDPQAVIERARGMLA